MGDARGHWEGSTLVVETTNFKDRSTYRNANAATLRLVERFTRTAPGRLEWAVTVDDSTTWTRPWTFAMPLTMNDREPVLEFACHEGNYAVPHILSGARAGERDRRRLAPVERTSARLEGESGFSRTVITVRLKADRRTNFL